MAGRLELIKFVMQALPTYTMHNFLLPKNMLAKIDSKMRNLFWGVEEGQSHHLYLRAWSKICIPKRKGGLGI